MPLTPPPASENGNPPLPLKGVTILVTRAQDQAQGLTDPLQRLGAKCLVQPVIEIHPVEPGTLDAQRLDQAICQLAGGQFEQPTQLVFASGNGAYWFFHRWQELEQPTVALASIRMVAIGAGTARKVARLLAPLVGLDVAQTEARIQTPPKANSESLADFLIEHARDEAIVLVRANRGSDVVRTRLAASPQKLTEIVAYRSTDVDSIDSAIKQALDSNQIDWLTLSSSAIATSAAHLFGPWLEENDGGLKAVSISPTTSAAWINAGLEPTAEATDYSLEGLVTAVVDWESRH